MSPWYEPISGRYWILVEALDGHIGRIFGGRVVAVDGLGCFRPGRVERLDHVIEGNIEQPRQRSRADGPRSA